MGLRGLENIGSQAVRNACAPSAFS
jgi:hypothetical protein